jgi:sec-independent protein translocase protein TatB
VFNFSGSEIVFLLLLALIILGPEKLPEAVRKFGKTYAEFKKVTTGFQTELKSALDEPMREMKETADALRKAAQFDVDFDPKSIFAGLTGKTDPAKSAAVDAVAPGGDVAPAETTVATPETTVATPEAPAETPETTAEGPAEIIRPPGPNFASANPRSITVADNEPPLASGSSGSSGSTGPTPPPSIVEDGAESA